MTNQKMNKKLPSKSIPIDEEGYPLIGELRVTDPAIAREILTQIKIAENGSFVTTLNGEEYFIEAFDEPLVARHFTPWSITTAFEVSFEFKPETLTLDEWDRFHGMTVNGIPFVLSRNAQKQLFDLCDDYEDDSITIQRRKYSIKPWLSSDPLVQTSEFWSNIYINETPRWELNQAAPGLVDLLPRLKLPKSRILVLGCGSGNDANEFAQQGHLVTAVDFSEEAISKAKQKYGSNQNITFLNQDIFKLGHEHDKNYDFVFEHTCFCAIAPEKRNELIKIWNRCLVDGGHLLAILFAMEKRNAPPFGGTEWEYRERLKKYYQFLFWGRLQNSIDRRNGKELLIYAKKKT
jgi:SAM-dependent methyltransferase